MQLLKPLTVPTNFLAFSLSCFLALFLSSQSSNAQGITGDFLLKASGIYQFSPQMVKANFSVGQLPFGSLKGRFLEVSGRFILNGKQLERSSVTVAIKPKSIKTENPQTDIYLRGPDFFNVANFPVATFKSTKIRRTGDKTAELDGVLKIKTISVPMAFTVTFNRAQRDPEAGNRFVLEFQAKSSFNRSKFGMSAGIPIFSDAVDLDIQILGTRK